ncbi:ABC transporter substrate-binding protein [Nonomuraea sp. KC401]|uniref:ABC transporter substrate-binding protein n=1 Tax=Nonomuraea sp. K271 TaxID=1848319 RepID=UPI0010FDD0B4|nr:ABC transporter substrate-binding protein [Nonomuraea sp. K271]NBE92305.1 ABC transporter substrate-binding protein [Nonomuraea sp. K271]TLF77179.1 ABC transporter substrate-binding protein [Nonomuraea sp. KC401]
MTPFVTGHPFGARRPRSLAAALVALVVAVTGCAERGSTAPADVLNVGQISNSVAFFPLFVAEKNGYFKEQGVTLGERPRLGTGAKVAAALKSGSIDLGAGVMTDALNLSGVDQSTRLAANLVDKYYVDIVVSGKPGWPGESEPLDDRIRALRGKKIGITGPGSGTEALVTYLFARVGLRTDTDAELVNLGGVTSAALGALKSGRVDALAFFQPIAQQAEAAGIGRNYISPARGDVPQLSSVAHGVVFTTQATMEEKAEEVAAFQRAVGRAQRLIHEQPAQVEPLLAEYLKGTDAEALAALSEIIREEIPKEIGFARTSYDTAVAFHRETGLIDRFPSYEEIVPQDLRIAGP